MAIVSGSLSPFVSGCGRLALSISLDQGRGNAVLLNSPITDCSGPRLELQQDRSHPSTSLRRANSRSSMLLLFFNLLAVMLSLRIFLVNLLAVMLSLCNLRAARPRLLINLLAVMLSIGKLIV